MRRKRKIGEKAYGIAKLRRVERDDWNQQLALSHWIETGQWPTGEKTKFGEYQLACSDEQREAVYTHALSHVDRGDKQPQNGISLEGELRIDAQLVGVDWTETLTQILAAIPTPLHAEILAAYESQTPLDLTTAGIIAGYIPTKDLDAEWLYAILATRC